MMASRGRWPGRSPKINALVNSDVDQWDDVLPVPKLSFSVASVIVFCLAVLCFANSHDAGLVFDDERAIIKNRDVLPETPLSEIFVHDFWGQMLDNMSHKSYRPLTVMTYRWNYAWAGGFHPRGFHVVNIVLHGLVSVIFLAVFSVLMSGYQVDQESARPVFASPRAALLCAVLFAVHPIHTESVAGVVGRADLLCALTCLLSFLLYARCCSPTICQVSYRPKSFSLVSLLASMCLCVVSTFCKEQGITVIGICSMYDVIVVCGVDPLHLLTYMRRGTIKDLVNNKQGLARWVKSLVKRHLILFLTGVTLLITRIRIMGSTTPIFTEDNNPHSFVDGTVLRVLNYNYLYAMNVWLLLNPWWLCCDWSMGCIPVLTSLADSRILADIALWVGFGALFYLSCHGELSRNRRILIISLAVLGIPFLPASNLFFRVGFVIAERILYLSCAGFCMLVVLGARQICFHLNNTAKQLVKTGFIFLILVYALRSIQRCQDYRGRTTLYTSALKVCPLNAKVHYNIAGVLTDDHDTDSAIEEYRLALELSPHYVRAMNNLAIIFRDKRQFQEAEELLESAVRISPSDAVSWLNLGVVRIGLHKMGPGEEAFLEALRHRRKYPGCLFNLGNLYKYQGRHTEAINAWQNATQISPTYTGAWKHTLMLLHDLGKYGRAIEVGKEALKVLPDEADLVINLANVYTKVEKFKEGERLLQAAIKGNKSPLLHHSLGMLYYRWEKYEEAEKAMLRAKQLSPSDPLILNDLQMIHRKMGKIK